MMRILDATRLAIPTILLVVTGCSQPAEPPATATAATADAGHALHGWWCTEHGVPEDVCALCSAKVAAEFKAKGDWCKEHGRPESQCFVCHPEREAEFAALYEAKFGELPPKPTADDHDHDHGHDHDHAHESDS